MNYELLLKKYMEHVRQCEGIDFTDRLNERMGSDVLFSEEETASLKRISEEINAALE
jgi:hypothetical protein